MQYLMFKTDHENPHELASHLSWITGRTILTKLNSPKSEPWSTQFRISVPNFIYTRRADWLAALSSLQDNYSFTLIDAWD